MVAPRRDGSAACTVPAVSAELSRKIAAYQASTAAAASGADRPTVAPTPNPNFRRLDAVVEGDVDGVNVRLLTLSTVMGRY